MRMDDHRTVAVATHQAKRTCPPIRLVAATSNWLAHPGSAAVLGALRIAAFAGMLLTFVQSQPWKFTDLPTNAISYPDFGGWLVTLLPLGWVPAGGVVFGVACTAALAGWHSRTSSAVASILAIWILGVPNLFGKVDHLGHHLIWFGLLCAASPCGDAFAIDCRSHAKPVPSAVYGFPLRIGWLLIGLLYLSAGIPKAQTGIEWALSDTLRDHMWVTWHVASRSSIFRFDQYPFLYESAGLATLAIELLFLPAIMWRRTRRFAVIGGLAFHLGTGVVLGIIFHSLVACYIAFIPPRHLRTADDRDPHAPTVLVGVGLLVVVFGVAMSGNVQSWPVAAYPKFAPSGPYATTFTAVGDGDELNNPHDLPPHRWRFLLASASRDPAILKALQEHFRVDRLDIVGTTVYADPDAKRVVRQFSTTSSGQ